MSLALAATGRLSSVTNFLASSRISMMLFSRAKRGASGKDATNSVTNPNWMTVCVTTQRLFTLQSLSMYIVFIGFIHFTTMLIIFSGSQTSRTNRRDVVLEHFHHSFEWEHERSWGNRNLWHVCTASSLGCLFVAKEPIKLTMKHDSAQKFSSLARFSWFQLRAFKAQERGTMETRGIMEVTKVSNIRLPG